jgi:glycosyltransferase involved in cell wall biosynthesis
MRIALDTSPLYVTQSGVARYIRGLLRGFQQVAAPDVEIFPLAWEVESFSYRQPQRALKTFYREFIWSRFSAPRQLRNNGIQVFHGTPFVHTPREIKKIITMHDLAVFRFPQRFRRWQRYASRRYWLNLNRTDHIICISQFTADEAMSLLKLPAARITVIYNGSDFHPDETPSEMKPGFNVPSEFFLFVGSLEPGKNLALLKEVYRLAESQKQTLPPLMIVGARWKGVAHEGKPPQNWYYLGRQPDDVLVYLYHRALALIFPSKYEGFGLPVAEAMALGCPVICSPIASLPEVGGDAAMLTDMTPLAYLKATERISREAGLRDELIAKGRTQAAKFSWKKCAGEVLEVYRSALAAR